MSVQAITWALAYRVETTTEKAVLLVLANYADGDGLCWPGQESIAAQACCSDRTVRRALDDLEARGVISRRHRQRNDGSRTSDEIKLVIFAETANRTDRPQGQPDKVSTRPTGHPDQSNRTSTTIQPDRVSGLTTFEPSEEPSGIAVDAREADDWPSGRAMDHAQALCREADTAMLDLARQPTLLTTLGRLPAWRAAGASWEHDVLPNVVAMARKARSPIASWKFFDAAIAQTTADNRQALTLPEARHVHPAPSSKRQARDANLARALAAIDDLAAERAGYG